MKKNVAITVLTILSCIASYAQSECVLQIETDKKILDIEKLGFPESATVLRALSILPELLGKVTEDIVINYDIKIDGFSLGNDFWGALSQLRLGQVSKIEISNSPLDSYKNNGQGGSINIVLKKLNDGFSGEVSLTGTSIPSIEPMAFIGFKKNDFTLRGMAEANHQRVRNNENYMRYFDNDGNFLFDRRDTLDNKQTSETIRLLMEYRPTSRDEFKLRLSENFIWADKSQDIYFNCDTSFLDTDRKITGRKFSLNANTSFNHTFTFGDIFKLEANYSRINNNANTAISGYKEISSENLNNSISGKTEYEHHLKVSKPDNFSKLIFGVNLNMATTEKYDLFSYSPYYSESSITNSIVHTWFISPYAIFDAKFGNWRLKADIEYQSFNYNVRGMTNDKFTQKRGDVTGKIMAGYQINRNNHLQLIFDRKLERPGGAMLYPYVIFNPEQDRFEYGNPDLKPMLINEVSLNYITDINSGPHNVVINGEVSYLRVEDMLTPVMNVVYPDINYYTFKNIGTNHILSAELTTIYKVGILTLSFTGNVYGNNKITDSSSDCYINYNLSLMPALNFRKGWKALAKATYHSRITSAVADLGSSTLLSLSAGKSWKKISIYALGSLPLNGKCVDRKNEGERIVETSYYNVFPSIGLSCNYKF